jgi:hypothetical protein
VSATLNPQLDVVFKLLFGAERNRDILRALLNDILRPKRPITSVDVANPEIRKDVAADRGLVLDVLAVHDDGTRTDIEMQTRDRGATEKRALYHWARIYRDGIGRGTTSRRCILAAWFSSCPSGCSRRALGCIRRFACSRRTSTAR